LAALQAAEGHGPIPWEIVEDQLCERYHCLPWDLEGQDVGRLLRNSRLRSVYDVIRKSNGGTELTNGESEIMGRVLQMRLENNG